MLIDKFYKERQRFELESRYVNTLGGFYAFTYKNNPIPHFCHQIFQPKIYTFNNNLNFKKRLIKRYCNAACF